MTDTPNIPVITAIQKMIRDDIEGQFNMRKWIETDPECGTAFCIGGAADIVYAKEHGLPVWVRYEYETVAYMGISGDIADELFYVKKSRVPLCEITADMAIRALEDLKVEEFKDWRDYLDEAE